MLRFVPNPGTKNYETTMQRKQWELLLRMLPMNKNDFSNITLYSLSFGFITNGYALERMKRTYP